MSSLYKRGRTWYMNYLHNGKWKQESARTRHKEVAERMLQGIEAKIIMGKYFDVHETDKILFKDAAAECLSWSKPHKKKSSYERDVLSLEKHLIPYFQGKYLQELTNKMIEDYQAKRANKVKPAAVNREIQCLKHLLKKTVENGELKENPAYEFNSISGTYTFMQEKKK